MPDICIFKRVEKTYMLSVSQYRRLLDTIGFRLTADEHGKSTVCNIYLDTENYLLIRNSINAIAYKEKLRIRSYGTPKPTDRVFLEIKKKYKGVVYKRRVAMTLCDVMRYIETGKTFMDSQIMREIDYAMHCYGKICPAAVLSYEREAFYETEAPSLRLTFDTNVRYRTTELDMTCGTHGKTILPEDTVLLEIKTNGSMPVWLAHALDECGIFPSSFSKYGTAYREFSATKESAEEKGELIDA